jgi:hypothetical protein
MEAADLFQPNMVANNDRALQHLRIPSDSASAA